MSNEKVKIVIAFAAGICVGGGIGYVLAERKVRSETEAEINGVKNLYRRLHSEYVAQARSDWQSQPVDADEDSEEGPDESFTEEEVAQGNGYNRALGYSNVDDLWIGRHQDPNYIKPTPTEPEPGGEEVEQDLRKEDEYVRKIRVFNPHRNGDPDDVTQWERDPNRPYVITEMEYRIDFPHHEKISITYYKGDETLADERSQYIPAPDETVGLENLQYFGLASGDPRVLHIRNEVVGADFEVSLDDGAYSTVVLGFNIDEDVVKESKNRIKKMRNRE